MDFLERMHADAMREATGLLARWGYDPVQAAGLAEARCMSVGTRYRHSGNQPRLSPVWASQRQAEPLTWRPPKGDPSESFNKGESRVRSVWPRTRVRAMT